MIGTIRTLLPILGIAGLGYGFVSSTKEALAFSEQMGKVSTLLSTESLPILTKYSTEVKKMSTTFGLSTKDLTDGLYEILSSSIEDSEALSHL